MKSALLKFVFLFIATSSICGMCSKDDAGSDENQDNNAAPAFSFDFNGNPLSRWTATKIDKPEILPNTGVIFNFINTGNSVYNQLLKDKYPGLTEEINVFLFTNNLQTGRYALKYGPGTQGTAEFAIKQASASGAPYADSLYRIIEVGAESYFQIDKIENNKMSGVFYFYFYQPITGANSLKTLECKEGRFTAIPMK
jgi:hypothetical protein